MTWIGTILIGVGKRIAPAVVIWYFTAERGDQHREWDRSHWWSFEQSAKKTKTKVDDAVATYLKHRFNFHDNPETKENQKIAEKAGLLLGSNGVSGPHVP